MLHVYPCAPPSFESHNQVWMESKAPVPHERKSHSNIGAWLRRYGPALGLAAGCVLVVTLLAYPYLTAAYHLQAGGRALALAQDSGADHPDQLDRAIRHFQRAVESAPADGYIYRRLGQAWLLAGNNEAARDALLRAVDLRPRHPLIWIELGRAYDGLGEAGQALAAYERGGYGPAREAAMVNYLKVADWQIGAGADGEAQAMLARVLALDADSLPALYRLLGICRRAGAAEAETLRERLAALAAEDLARPEEPRLQAYWQATMVSLVEDGIWTGEKRE